MDEQGLEGLQINAERVLAIVKLENPGAYELALRRAVIEEQSAVIAAMREGITPPVEAES